MLALQHGACLSKLLSMCVCTVLIFLTDAHTHTTVASVVLTNRKLAMGTYNGEVYVYNAPVLLEEGVELSQAEHAVLRAHKPKSKVYSLACIEGRIKSDGYTSVFPAYIGRSGSQEVTKDFLVSVGYGREYTDIGKLNEKIFKSSLKRDGTFVNIWML